jgi:hypothetical protein
MHFGNNTGQFAIINEKFAGDVASLGGWNRFCKWADGLSLRKYREIVQLTEHGWTENVRSLRKQLLNALANESPPRDVKSVGTALASILEKAPKDAAYIIISDGANG